MPDDDIMSYDEEEGDDRVPSQNLGPDKEYIPSDYQEGDE